MQELFISSVLYTNICSLLAKFNDFVSLVCVNCPDFILISETWLNKDLPDSIVALQDYELYRSDRKGKRGGGVCMYASRKITSIYNKFSY